MKPHLLLLPFWLIVFSQISCTAPAASDPKADLVTASKDPAAKGYNYASEEADGQTVTMLTNPAVNAPIKPGKDDETTLLRYTQVNDKGGTTTLYKSELIKKNSTMSIVVTDLTAGKVIWDKPFLEKVPDLDTLTIPRDGFETLQDCINDFNCKHKGALICEANETCENQFAALTCCLKNGQCFSVHLIYPPTSWRCKIRDLVPELEGLVLSR